MSHEEFLAFIEAVIGELHQSQVMKVQRIAQDIIPGLSAEDIRNPDDFPELVSNPRFTYEDGIAAGGPTLIKIARGG